MKTEIRPRYSFQIKLDKDNKKMLPIEQVFPNTHPSYERFCKLEIARDIKENVARINTEEKLEGYSKERLILNDILDSMTKWNMSFLMETS